MTYLEKVTNVLISTTCPGVVMDGAPIRGADNGCLINKAAAPCTTCWHQQVPGTEGIATGAALPRNDSKEAVQE